MRGTRLIGKPLGYSRNKEALTLAKEDLNYSSRTVYTYELTNLAQDDADNNLRDGYKVDCVGFRFNININNTTANEPLYLNMVFYTYRREAEAIQTGDAGSSSFNESDAQTKFPLDEFFSDKTSENGYVSFHRQHPNLVLNKYPLNQDKFNVLKRKRILLGARNQTTLSMPSAAFTEVYKPTNPNANSYRNMQYWLPIKRQLKYLSGEGSTCTSRIFVMWWCDTLNSVKDDPATVGSMRMTIYCHMNYRDV